MTMGRNGIYESDIESFSWAFLRYLFWRNEQSTNQFVMISGIFCEQQLGKKDVTKKLNFLAIF